MPVISGESRYERLEIGRTLDASDARRAFWAHVINSGCAGHTYGANGIWQVNRTGEPYGKSPAGNNWGTTPWNEAMSLPGSSQLSAAKKWLEKLPWFRFETHPEWISLDGVALPPPALHAWIWLEPGASSNAPIEARFFRRTFELPDGKIVKHARLRATADDFFTVWLNGIEIGSGQNWKEPQNFEVSRNLRPGRNVIAIRAGNGPGPANANPAGLNAAMEIEFTDLKKVSIATDANWRVARDQSPDWHAIDFDDRLWLPAAVLGNYGCAPWGILDTQSAATPLAAGEAAGYRIFYLLSPGPVRIRQLRPNAEYRLSYFDPVEGRESDPDSVRADAAGEIRLPSPPYSHDVVIKLEPH
jgi:hypothetical protein